jgi:hypothetical protein
LARGRSQRKGERQVAGWGGGVLIARPVRSAVVPGDYILPSIPVARASKTNRG